MLKNIPSNMIPLTGASVNGKNEVSNSKKDTRDPRMLEAAKSFENQFVRQMISEMRKTIPKDDLVPDSMADGIFKEQLDNEYADQWVNQGGIGLTDIIYQQLDEKYGKHVSQLPHSQGEMIPFKSGGVPNAPADTRGVNGGAPVNSQLADHAQGPRAIADRRGEAGPGASALGSAAINNLRRQSPLRAADLPRDILARADKGLFLAKKESDGFSLKSREPLPEVVGLRSPMSGVVLQAAALEDGRQMIVVKHDQGLISRFVHSGNNRVKSHERVDAGSIIAELPASRNGEAARVFFGLRPGSKIE